MIIVFLKPPSSSELWFHSIFLCASVVELRLNWFKIRESTRKIGFNLKVFWVPQYGFPTFPYGMTFPLSHTLGSAHTSFQHPNMVLLKILSFTPLPRSRVNLLENNCFSLLRHIALDPQTRLTRIVSNWKLLETVRCLWKPFPKRALNLNKFNHNLHMGYWSQLEWLRRHSILQFKTMTRRHCDVRPSIVDRQW